MKLFRRSVMRGDQEDEQLTAREIVSSAAGLVAPKFDSLAPLSEFKK